MIEYSSLGGMAQLVEHSLHMRGVTGSSPVVSTNIRIPYKNVGFFSCLYRQQARTRTVSPSPVQNYTAVTKVTLHAIDLR